MSWPSLRRSKVSALAVVGGSSTQLGCVGGTGCGEPPGELRVGGGAEIVAVGDGEVPVAALEQGVEDAGRREAGVHLAVAGWAPFQGWVGGPGHGDETIDADLGFGALQEVDG